MIWINFLHFYQPYNQQKDILNRIVNECYLPVLKGYLERPNAKAVFNVNGALSLLLKENNYDEVINMLRELVKRGNIDFTGSGIYHPILPLLPENEIIRQIDLNTEVNRQILGEKYNPKGFFPPEMAVSSSLLGTLSKLKYEWVCASDVANMSGADIGTNVFKHTDTGMSLLFRNKRASSLVLSGVVHSPEDMLTETSDIINKDAYWFTVMDAETFGHHRINHDKFLFELYDSKLFNYGLVSDLSQLKLPEVSTNIRPCTWTNEEQDFWMEKEQDKVNSFVLWKDSSNPIHALQWELTNYAISAVQNYADKKSDKLLQSRTLLDRALASDQYWWASVKPWWSLEMVEQGAYHLKEVLLTLNGVQDPTAEKLYHQILDKAFEWQRDGTIREKHIANSGTYMKTPLKDRAPAEWYNQILLEFEDEMRKSAEKQDYEKAIKWRDAILKVNNRTDIFDILHVLDELNWTTRRIPTLKPFLTYEWEEIPPYAKKFLRDVKTKEEFEAWKQREASDIIKA